MSAPRRLLVVAHSAEQYESFIRSITPAPPERPRRVFDVNGVRGQDPAANALVFLEDWEALRPGRVVLELTEFREDWVRRGGVVIYGKETKPHG